MKQLAMATERNAERDARDAERDAKEQREKNKLLFEGLPEIGQQAYRAVKPSVGSKRTQTFQRILLRRKPFGFLLPPECLEAQQPSSVWAFARAAAAGNPTGRFVYSTEFTIQNFANNAFVDVACIVNQATQARPVPTHVHLQGENAIGELRPDFSIYAGSDTIGFAEVKLPLLVSQIPKAEQCRADLQHHASRWQEHKDRGERLGTTMAEPSLTTTTGLDAMNRDRAIQQCTDYLFKLRTEFGVRYSTCLLFTGREVSVLWLDDEHANQFAALSNGEMRIGESTEDDGAAYRCSQFIPTSGKKAKKCVEHELVRLCVQNDVTGQKFVQHVRDSIPFANDPPIPSGAGTGTGRSHTVLVPKDEDRRIMVNQSEIFKCTDPRAGAFLVSVFNKMSLSPIYGAPKELLQRRRLYRMAPVTAAASMPTSTSEAKVKAKAKSKAAKGAAAAAAAAASASASASASAASSAASAAATEDSTSSPVHDRGIYWSCLTADLSISWFTLAPKDPSVYVLLQQMSRGGRDGEVWLACPKTGGDCCILKFRKDQRTDADSPQLVSPEEEAQAWRDAYGQATVLMPPVGAAAAAAGGQDHKAVTIFTSAVHVRECPGVGGSPALVMPFVYTFADHLRDTMPDSGSDDDDASASASSAAHSASARSGPSSYRASHVFRTIRNPDGSQAKVNAIPSRQSIEVTADTNPDAALIVQRWRSGNRNRAAQARAGQISFTPLVTLLDETANEDDLSELVSFSHQMPPRRASSTRTTATAAIATAAANSQDSNESEEENAAVTQKGQVPFPHDNREFDELVALELASKEYHIQAIEAATRLLRMGILHLDPKPEHVGLLPIAVVTGTARAPEQAEAEGDGGEGGDEKVIGIAFLPVLIDLSEIQRFDVATTDQPTMDQYCRDLEIGLEVPHGSIQVQHGKHQSKGSAIDRQKRQRHL